MNKQFERMLQSGDFGFLPQEAWQRAVEYFLEHDAADKALQTLTFAQTQHPYCTDFLVLRAEALRDSGQWQSAVKTCVQAEQKGERSLSLFLLKADAQTELKDFDAALKTLHNALDYLESRYGENDNAFAQIYTHIANIYEEQQQFEHLFDTLRLAAQHDSDDDELMARLGTVVERLKNYEQSIIVHQQIVDNNPYATQAWLNIGVANAAIGNAETAIEALEYAIAIDENATEAYIRLAQIWIAEGLYERADQTLQQAEHHADNDATDPDIWYWRGCVQEGLENIVAAKTFFRKATQRNPQHHAAFYRLGEMAAFAKQWTDAVIFYHQATQFANGNGNYWAALAHAYMCINQPEKAAQAYEYALKADPQQVDFWLGAINCALCNDDAAHALTLAEDAEGFCPHPKINYAKFVCLLELRKRKAALLHLQQNLINGLNDLYYLFDLMPSIVRDTEVVRLINAAKEADTKKKKRTR